MTTTSLMPSARARGWTNAGLPAAGHLLYTYESGTTTPKAAYTDSAKTTPHTNPIVLDAKGEALIYWEGNYRVDLKTAAGVQVTGYPVDDFETPVMAGTLAEDSGGGMIGFLYGATYGVGTIGRWLQDLMTDTGSSFMGFIQGAAGSVLRTVRDKLRERISVKDFGAVGDGVTDDTAALLLAKAYAIANVPCVIDVPAGTYCHTGLGNWAYGGLELKGHSHRTTILKRTTDGSAFLVDAFEAGLTGDDATAPFCQGMNVSDITFEGMATTAIIVELQGLARCAWSNVWAREGEPVAGIAFRMHGCMLSTYYNLGCSTTLLPMTNRPFEGLRMSAGTRNGVNIGNSSNNCFTNPYLEGLGVGMRLAGADNNTFISGSSEANTVYDLLVAAGSRYNSFIGMGFESLIATANISDGGIYTKYLNCYANKSVLIAGRGIEVSGGYYQRIEPQSTAVKARIHNVTLSNWEATFPGTGGYFQHASATSIEWSSLYDAVGATYLYPYKARTGITVTASPFQWQNTTGQYVEVLLQTGTITQIRILRGGDNWLNPIAIPGKHLLAPTDTIEVSWSVSPGMSYVPHNGFQG